jgi:dienelactone hydrolase
MLCLCPGEAAIRGTGMRVGLLSFVLALGLAGCLPHPVPPGTPPGPTEPEAGPDRAQHWWVPVLPYANGSGSFLLDTMIYRPPGPGPFPLVTINHGVPGDKRRLRATEPAYQAAAHWWVTQGYAVAVPLRRGIGLSQGEFAESTDTCDAADFARVAFVAAADIKGVARYLAAEPFIDPHRIVVAGQSVGGFAGLAVAADPPPGVIAVVDFAGGIGGYGDGTICGGRDGLIEAARQLGLRAKLPTLWLYAANDQWFGAVARPMFEAYRAGAKPPVRFVALPPFGPDGHATLYRADPAVWGSAVAAFMATVR